MLGETKTLQGTVIMKCLTKLYVCFRMAIACVFVVLFCNLQQLHGGSFQNLDFESAVIEIGTPTFSQLPASTALPSWTVSNNYYGSKITYNMLSVICACISVYDVSGEMGKPLEGDYSVGLKNGFSGLMDEQDNPIFCDVYISQVGDVPSNAKSLMFQSDMTNSLSEMQVSLNGTAIPFSLYSTGSIINTWGPVKTYILDISAFTGVTNVELKFSTSGEVNLDAIQFSTIVVPEPGTLAMLAVGLFGLLAYAWRSARVSR
jgi:hypothetical protein